MSYYDLKTQFINAKTTLINRCCSSFPPKSHNCKLLQDSANRNLKSTHRFSSWCLGFYAWTYLSIHFFCALSSSSLNLLLALFSFSLQPWTVKTVEERATVGDDSNKDYTKAKMKSTTGLRCVLSIVEDFAVTKSWITLHDDDITAAEQEDDTLLHMIH